MKAEKSNTGSLIFWKIRAFYSFQIIQVETVEGSIDYEISREYAEKKIAN